MTDAIDRSQQTFLFERHIAASPDDVFNAWTRPEELTHWWDPTGKKLLECTVDLRLNGAFRFVTDGHAPPFEGIYRVIERPSRLEFEAMGARGIIILEAVGTHTRMRVSICSPTREHFEMFLKLGVNTGTSATFDQLVRHVQSRARSAS